VGTRVDRPTGCALVTGASRGIGAAIAVALADRWPLVINYRSDAQAAERIAQAIERSGGSAITACADVSDAAHVEHLFSRAEGECGPVLVLVNNAGVRADALVAQTGEADWSRVLDTNLSGAFRVTKRALLPMIRARFGRIINVGSVVGQRANPGQANYAASKAGLIGMTKTIAAEVARKGVTVNAVAPGLIDTDMTDGVGGALAAAIPARRAGTPAEVAACVAFLASAEASYVTGATLTVDGGLSA